MEINDAADKLKQLNAGKNMVNNKIRGFGAGSPAAVVELIYIENT